MRSAVVSSLFIAALWLASASRLLAAAPVILPLVVHVAQVDGRPVATPDFMRVRVARANEIFAPYGVAFAIQKELPLPGPHADIATRRDRDALAQFVKRGAIHCFVVASLLDVDEPGRVRRGVHWHARGSGAHFVIASIVGAPDVLAHELGHYLGNPEHSQTPGNLMSYQHTEVLPFLDAGQVANLRRALHGYLQSHELVRLRAAAL